MLTSMLSMPAAGWKTPVWVSVKSVSMLVLVTRCSLQPMAAVPVPEITESLIASISQSTSEAKARVRAFLEGRAAKVKAD